MLVFQMNLAHLVLKACMLFHGQAQLQFATCEMVTACRSGLLYGLLLALRYIMPIICWEPNANQGQAGGAGNEVLKAWAAQLLALLDETTAVALPPLCHPKAGFPGDIGNVNEILRMLKLLAISSTATWSAP